MLHMGIKHYRDDTCTIMSIYDRDENGFVKTLADFDPDSRTIDLVFLLWHTGERIIVEHYGPAVDIHKPGIEHLSSKEKVILSVDEDPYKPGLWNVTLGNPQQE